MLSKYYVLAGSHKRPAPKQQNPLPLWDKDDFPPPSYNRVSRAAPPELVIPTKPDLMFIMADFNGHCIDLNRWNLVVDKKHNWLIGANSTPFNMIMTPMLPMYSRKIQDAVLTEHAEMGYPHFIVCSGNNQPAPRSMWNFAENNFSWTPKQYVDWCNYVKSWGFFVVEWGPSVANHPYYKAAVDAHAVDWFGFGVEVDKYMTPEAYEFQLDAFLAGAGHGIPVGFHTTANYPLKLPRELFIRDWAKYNGKVHMFWEADQNQSAGTQAALLYYARRRVNLGEVGGISAAPDSRVYAFETMATAQLFGQCTESYGILRSLELLYATRTDTRIRPMAGVGNGLLQPSGWPFIK